MCFCAGYRPTATASSMHSSLTPSSRRVSPYPTDGLEAHHANSNHFMLSTRPAMAGSVSDPLLRYKTATAGAATESGRWIQSSKLDRGAAGDEYYGDYNPRSSTSLSSMHAGHHRRDTIDILPEPDDYVTGSSIDLDRHLRNSNMGHYNIDEDESLGLRMRSPGSSAYGPMKASSSSSHQQHHYHQHLQYHDHPEGQHRHSLTSSSLAVSSSSPSATTNKRLGHSSNSCMMPSSFSSPSSADYYDRQDRRSAIPSSTTTTRRADINGRRSDMNNSTTSSSNTTVATAVLSHGSNYNHEMCQVMVWNVRQTRMSYMGLIYLFS